MRDVNRLVKLFKQNGFTLAREARHQIWRCPCGHTQITIHKTGGARRGHDNAEARIRRAAKECTPTEERRP